ncbi:MAG: hypothetical protein FWF50_00440 [Defluviitaleaceae bacterium]|nr:hypothetical protein [Defluviitaleaceae bacterium]
MDVKFTSNKKAVLQQFDRNVGKTLTAIGMKQQELAALEITDMGIVDTGLLRASNGYQVNLANQEVMVGNSVSYAPFIEFGTGVHAELGQGRQTPWTYFDELNQQFVTTSGMEARPFLRNSILKYEEDYKEIVNAFMGEGFES